MHRFLLQVLPKGSKRIRHYEVLAPSCKAVKLNAARLALEMPLPSPQAMESAKEFWHKWPGWMWACARVAAWGACKPLRYCWGQAAACTQYNGIATGARAAVMKRRWHPYRFDGVLQRGGGAAARLSGTGLGGVQLGLAQQLDWGSFSGFGPLLPIDFS